MRAIRRRALILLAGALFLAPIHCRKAEGEVEDPVDREAVAALAGYLRIDTSNPPGNETSGANYLQQLLAKEGIPATLVGRDPRRQSVYARLRSGTNEKALILLHHIDVVPAAAGEWTKPPFAGTEAGGYLWGRGALDVKSLGIAELMAFVDLKRRNVPLRRDVIFLGVADEELGGGHGCRELLEQHPDLFANAGFVVNEGGSSETAVDRVLLWGIEVQQKIPLWLRLHAKGAPGHSASPPEDGGTVARLVTALDAVQKIPTPYRLSPAVERSFRAIGAAKKDAKGELLRTMQEPVDAARVDAVLPPGYRALLHDTIAITRVAGGTSVNAIPARAEADIDIRLLPDSDAKAMIERVRSAVGKSAEVEVLLDSPAAPESATDTELYAVLTKAMKNDEPTSSVVPVIAAGTTDSRFFRARGFVAYGVTPFRVNYYDADTVHGTDERIRVRFFSQGVKLMRKIVADFCARGA